MKESKIRTKLEQKQFLMGVQFSKCKVCGCTMILKAPEHARGKPSHVAVLVDSPGPNAALACFGCHRQRVKQEEYNQLPLKTKIKKSAPFQLFKRIKGRINKWYYFSFM